MPSLALTFKSASLCSESVFIAHVLNGSDITSSLHRHRKIELLKDFRQTELREEYILNAGITAEFLFQENCSYLSATYSTFTYM